MQTRTAVVVWSILVLAGMAGAQLDDLGTQTAVLEGVQITSEPSTEPGEKMVTCYFIFREKPSSFFYEIKAKENKLVFEFNDVKKGSAPIQSVSEPPIKGFTIRQDRVDVNKEIRGLKPEWHDVVYVTFSLDAIPRITVKEEYSVISFSYKWSTDPTMAEKYVEDTGRPKWLIPTLSGVGGAAVAGVIIALVAGGDVEPEPPQPLSTDDLPVHTPYTP
ncbi:MAG: hypothetical protein GF331_16105 [Chitinivibrionales bacterium]|nr:hypothetical protein [Chitinivibrionales bacterium]